MWQRDNLNYTNELKQIQRYSLLSQQPASKKQKFGLEKESNKTDPSNVNEVTAELPDFLQALFVKLHHITKIYYNKKYYDMVNA